MVAVLLLGGGTATLRRVVARGEVGAHVVLSLALLGLAAALLVAGRIVFVSARAQRAFGRADAGGWTLTESSSALHCPRTGGS